MNVVKGDVIVENKPVAGTLSVAGGDRSKLKIIFSSLSPPTSITVGSSTTSEMSEPKLGPISVTFGWIIFRHVSPGSVTSPAAGGFDGSPELGFWTGFEKYE